MLIKIINDYGSKSWNLIAELFNENLAETAMKNPDIAGRPTVIRNGK